jgi:hypothetical protein
LREISKGVNMDMMRMINAVHLEANESDDPDLEDSVPWRPLIEVLVQQIRKGKHPAKLAIMRWWYLLFKINQKKVSQSTSHCNSCRDHPHNRCFSPPPPPPPPPP